jgi:hypothetical protein
LLWVTKLLRLLLPLQMHWQRRVWERHCLQPRLLLLLLLLLQRLPPLPFPPKVQIKTRCWSR